MPEKAILTRMKEHSIKITLLVLSVFGCGAASAQKGYFIKDSTYSETRFINKRTYDNNRGIQYFANDRAAVQIFRPGEVTEFGLPNGDVYVSRTVNVHDSVRPYFLFRRVDGITKLYEVKTKTGPVYFYENAQGLNTLSKDGLERQLTSLMSNCDGFAPLLRQVRYRASDLEPVFAAYNRCDVSYLPRFRWGIFAGFSTTKYVLKKAELFIADIDFRGTDPVIGLFVETPLFGSRHWSINVQGSYQRHSYRKDAYVVKASAINVPALFKYRTVGNKVRGFLNAGPAIGYLLTRDNYVDSSPPASLASITMLQLSATIGAGMEFSITPRNSLSIELRTTNGQGFGSGSNKQAFDALQLLGGFSF